MSIERFHDTNPNALNRPWARRGGIISRATPRSFVGTAGAASRRHAGAYCHTFQPVLAVDVVTGDAGLESRQPSIDLGLGVSARTA